MATAHPPDHARTVTVFEPTATGIPPLRPYLHEIWRRRPFMWHLARTELKARHYATVIGQLWILLDPLLMASVYYLLRTVVRPAGTDAERNQLIAHLIMGVMVYQYVSNSLTNGSRSITGNQQMILNTAFPRAIFPIVAVGQALLDYAPTIVVLFATQLLLRQPLGYSLLFLPLVLAMITVFNLGLALLFGPITVFFRDTSGFLPYITQVWLYASPILYTIKEIPENLFGYLQWNPLFPFFAILERIFAAESPDPAYFARAFGWTMLSFIVGAVVFLKKERDFAARI